MVKNSRRDPQLTMDERRETIVEFLKKEAKISVEELAERLKVSQVTIRKDLDTLEKRGLIERSHGNAMFSQQSRFNIAFLEKLQLQAREKELIAKAAAAYVHEGDSIILDSGTTTLSLAKALVGRFKSLFVITNSVPAALELTKAGYDLLLVGGQVRNHSLALIGPWGVKNLESYHVDRAFMGTSGITLAHGFSTPGFLGRSDEAGNDSHCRQSICPDRFLEIRSQLHGQLRQMFRYPSDTYRFPAFAEDS